MVNDEALEIAEEAERRAQRGAQSVLNPLRLSNLRDALNQLANSTYGGRWEGVPDRPSVSTRLRAEFDLGFEFPGANNHAVASVVHNGILYELRNDTLSDRSPLYIDMTPVEDVAYDRTDVKLDASE